MKLMSKIFFFFLLYILVVSCKIGQEANYEIIPAIQNVKLLDGGAYVFDEQTIIAYPEGNDKMRRNAEFLAGYISDMTGVDYPIEIWTNQPQAIVLELGSDNENFEGYSLNVSESGVVIRASSEAGIFYGIQTLRKSIPMTLNQTLILPSVSITDKPAYAYRGVMLDVARHRFTVDEIKIFIDMLAMHNINTFHWHLSDDQGWRIEIKKYPRLTEVGSKRDETVIGYTADKFDGKPYGGFYSQQQAKDIVQYAAHRHITVVPEINITSHNMALLASYPEFGCENTSYKVSTDWCESEGRLCFRNPKVIEFAKDAISEIVDIFPSKYIHIGGGARPSASTESCSECKVMNRKLKLTVEKEDSVKQKLYNVFISDMINSIKEKDRKVIVWGEMLENGLTDDVTVMVQSGDSVGVKAIEMGNDIIIAQSKFVNFDYYQIADSDNEPLASDGFLSLEKVYNLTILSDSLVSDNKGEVLGAQASVWTEYIPNFEQLMYMTMPRIAALAEIQWSNPSARDYNEFLSRIHLMLQKYDLYNYNYAKHLFNVTSNVTINAQMDVIEVALSTLGNAPIYYTLDGSEPSVNSKIYDIPLFLNRNCTIKAVSVRLGKSSMVYSESFDFSIATAKKAALIFDSHPLYSGIGAGLLIDGITGSYNYRSGKWIGYNQDYLELIVDLGFDTSISSVSFNALINNGDWIFDAKSIEVSVSFDSMKYTDITRAEFLQNDSVDLITIRSHAVHFEPVSARYVKVRIEPVGALPEWHAGRGKSGFLFVDEIRIR